MDGSSKMRIGTGNRLLVGGPLVAWVLLHSYEYVQLRMEGGDSFGFGGLEVGSSDKSCRIHFFKLHLVLRGSFTLPRLIHSRETHSFLRVSFSLASLIYSFTPASLIHSSETHSLLRPISPQHTRDSLTRE